MKQSPAGKHSYQLTRLGLINCFLVQEADGLTLIDANLRGSEESILAAAQTLGASIQRILLTHAHVDHVGSVDALVARLPGVAVGASPRSVPMLRQPANRDLQPGEPDGGGIRGGTPGIVSPVNLLLREGDRCGSLLVIETPGHIPGHLSFLDERDGTFYAGDALFTVDHLGVSGWSPWWFPLNKWWHRGVAKASAEKLLQHPIQRFACGHGPVREGGHGALEKAIALAHL